MKQITVAIQDIPSYGDYHGNGEVIELPDGYTAIVRMDYDTDYGAPWENCDGHGIVSEWTSRDKKPGEFVLSGNSRGSSRRFYDFAESVKIAKRDGWDTAPYRQGTKGERAHRAAMADFEFLRAWCNDDWHYVVVYIELQRNGETVADETCGGIETFHDYWREWTAEQLQYHLNADRTARANATIQTRRETKERNYWACRDVVTV